MIQNKKRIISLILMLTLLVSALVVGAVTASAEDGTWTLVTDASKLDAGDKVVIVAKDSDTAMSTTQNGNNRGQASVTKNGNTVTLSNDVQIITLEAGTKDNTFAFKTDAGYLYAASGSKNYLRSEATKSDNSSWSISIEDGVATIKAQGTNSRNWLRYNSTNNPPIFSCYGSGQADVCIYKFETVAADHICSSETLNLVEAKDSTCTQAGNDAYYACSGCSEIYEDVNAETPTTLAAVTKALADHDLTHHSENAATCTEDGNVEYWTCSECEKFFSDEECTSEIAEKDTVISAEGHDFVDGECSVCGEAADVATLVTDISTLAAGRKIIIVANASDYALSTAQGNNNRGQASVNKIGNTVTFGDDVQIITLETGSVNGTFAFNVGEGYLYAASSSSNYLRTQTTLNGNGSWAIEISDDGVATIKAQGTYSRNWLRYNSSNNPPIFSCYNSGQTDVCIYVLPCDHTYVNGVCSVCSHKAETFEEAITGTGTVQVPEGGVTVSQLTVQPGLVIDLNGHTLTVTGGVVTFDKDQIIDTSAKWEEVDGKKIFTAPTGIIEVEKSKIVIANPGEYLPVWNAEKNGYQVVYVTNQAKISSNDVENGKFSVAFRPAIGDTEYNTTIFDGGENESGVKFLINVYADDSKTPVISFYVDDEYVQGAYASKDSVRVINLKFAGADWGTVSEYTVELVIQVSTNTEGENPVYSDACVKTLAVVSATNE